jgi:hypothetical protein
MKRNEDIAVLFQRATDRATKKVVVTASPSPALTATVVQED